MRKAIVNYKYFGGANKLVEVVSIDNEKLEEVYYFDYKDFKENIKDLVELVANTTNYTLKKIA